MDRLTEHSEFFDELQPLSGSHHPRSLDDLIDKLLAPWNARTRDEIDRAARRKQLAWERDQLRPRLRIIAARVEALFRLESGTLRSERRTGRISTARHIAYYLCRVAGGSFPLTGANLGDDHSSVHQGVCQIRRRMDREAAFPLFIERLPAPVTGDVLIERPLFTTDRAPDATKPHAHTGFLLMSFKRNHTVQVPQAFTEHDYVLRPVDTMRTLLEDSPPARKHKCRDGPALATRNRP